MGGQRPSDIHKMTRRMLRQCCSYVVSLMLHLKCRYKGDYRNHLTLRGAHKSARLRTIRNPRCIGDRINGSVAGVRIMNTSTFWKKCSSCKKPIPYGGRYLRCGVSTCNTKRTSYAFCSMSCWSAHVPTMGHRNPWAEDETAPTQQEARRQEEPSSQPTRSHAERPPRERSERRVVRSAPTQSDIPQDVLVVVSKLKAYILARSDCKTSATVNDALSDIIRSECDRAIQRAIDDGRSTVMGRDFKG